jgi:hypothetical protein
LGNNDNLAKFIDDVSSLSGNNNHRGAGVVKRSLHITFDQPPLIDGSHSRSRTRHRRLRKKFHPNKLNNLPNIFQSTGTYNENLRTSHQIPDAVDDRLKRFRMLDPDEFQEMLNSFSQQNAPDEQLKGFNNLDSIGGMQLESKLIYIY